MVSGSRALVKVMQSRKEYKSSSSSEQERDGADHSPNKRNGAGAGMINDSMNLATASNDSVSAAASFSKSLSGDDYRNSCVRTGLRPLDVVLNYVLFGSNSLQILAPEQAEENMEKEPEDEVLERFDRMWDTLDRITTEWECLLLPRNFRLKNVLSTSADFDRQPWYSWLLNPDGAEGENEVKGLADFFCRCLCCCFAASKGGTKSPSANGTSIMRQSRTGGAGSSLWAGEREGAPPSNNPFQAGFAAAGMLSVPTTNDIAPERVSML